jgi:Trypsin
VSSCSLLCLHTTARCVYGYAEENLAIFVNFTGYADQSYAHKRNAKVVIHQTYDYDEYQFNDNDIALLFLDSPVTTEITPLQLNTEVGFPTDGQVLKAIGLGAVDGNGIYYPYDLMEVDLPKVNDESCKGIWFDYNGDNLDTKTTVCAGGEQGKGICLGDRGNQHTSTFATTKPFLICVRGYAHDIC